MPAVYDRHGFKFLYPENWSLEEQELPDDAVADVVTVYSPGGSFWTLTRFPEDREPRQVAEYAAQSIEQEYEMVERESIEEEMEGFPLEGCDLHFVYLDMTVTCTVRSMRHNEATYLVYTQGDDRELESISPIFRAMTTSLLRDQRARASSHH